MLKISLSLFLTVAAHVSALAQQQITIDPPQPQAGQQFRFTIAGAWRDSCTPGDPRVHVIDKKIFLTYSLTGGGCFSAVSPFSATATIPGLAAGTYQVRARLHDYDGPQEFFNSTVTISGTPSGITSIEHSFDTSAGNRVVILRGSFPCESAACSPPKVMFGRASAEAVERISENEIHAVAPAQTNVRTVDVTVEGSGYRHVLPNGFTYVGLLEYDRILIPLLTRNPVPGALGSLWKTEFQLVNRSDIVLEPGVDFFYLEPRCDTSACRSGIVPAKMQTPQFARPRTDVEHPPVAIFYVRRELAPYLSFTLRVRDLSRQSESWGTDVPVVRDRELRTVVTLVDIPLQPKFRQMLRVYMPDYVGCCYSKLELFSQDGTLLLSRLVELRRPDGSIGGLVPAPYLREGSREFPLQPAYTQIDLRSIPELENQSSVWLTVTSMWPPSRVWAMVSVTNDETQQVTLVTPK